MRLCDSDIEKYLAEGKIVIDPMPGQERISGVSVDVLLGNEFRVFQAHTAAFIDLSGPKEEVADAINRVMSDEIIIPDGEAFILHPGELALAVTLVCYLAEHSRLVGWPILAGSFGVDGSCDRSSYRSGLVWAHRAGIL